MKLDMVLVLSCIEKHDVHISKKKVLDTVVNFLQMMYVFNHDMTNIKIRRLFVPKARYNLVLNPVKALCSIKLNVLK